MRQLLPSPAQVNAVIAAKSRRTKPNGQVTGRFVLWDVKDGVWLPAVVGRNTALYTWGLIAAKSIGLADANYKVSSLYIEYKNVASPGDAIAVPTFGRDEGLAYLNSLPADQDYLRVPLLAEPTISIADGYEAYFDAASDEGNVLTFYGQTAGSAGQNSLDFSDTVNSKVFGVWLVATPVDGDPTRDCVLSRGYLPVPSQKLKLANSQIGLTWQFSFL